MAIARITSKGELTIPKEMRERLGVEPGNAPVLDADLLRGSS